MKTIRLLFAVIICVLSMRANCLVAQTSKSVDIRQNKAINQRTLRVRPLTTVGFSKSPPKHLHSQRPAIIGGPANKHASAINGTGMKRKP